MSKGNPVKGIRFDPLTLAAVEAAISQRNFFSRRKPWDFSAFVHNAIWEKLRKMQRGRAPRKRRRPEPSPVAGAISPTA